MSPNPIGLFLLYWRENEIVCWFLAKGKSIFVRLLHHPWISHCDNSPGSAPSSIHKRIRMAVCRPSPRIGNCHSDLDPAGQPLFRTGRCFAQAGNVGKAACRVKGERQKWRSNRSWKIAPPHRIEIYSMGAFAHITLGDRFFQRCFICLDQLWLCLRLPFDRIEHYKRFIDQNQPIAL